jgi:large subunit ribosomal protein L18
MDLKSVKKSNKRVYRRSRIKMRIRKVVSGTADRPRLSVFRSNQEIYAQVIDDLAGRTMVAASSREKGISEKTATKTEKAKQVGLLIAERAKEAGIEQVVFDRSGYLYHGRVKALADAAREGGLKF